MDDTTENNGAQPEPVLTRAGVVTAITVLAALLAYVGAGHVSTWLEQHNGEIASAILAVGPIVTGVLARRHVTPNASPKSTAGVRLVPADSLEAVDVSGADASADRALAEANAIAPMPDAA